jgi:hypothetical protein
MAEQNPNQVENAVAEGGAYEVIRKRLVEQGRLLNQQASALNDARLSEFGSSDLSVISRVRVRTENNCIARDMVQIGDYLLFGYNVFIGLKKETHIEDVFSLFKLNIEGENYSLEAVSHKDSFLTSTSFKNDFLELYRYYKQTRLVQLTVKDGKLLAGFQIGERLEDIRVFRWSVSADGKDITYIDNRGERDIQLPSAYDFEWTVTDRENTVQGRHSHINILDKVFVETINGDLTIKIENNTENGKGIYSEPVEDKTQSLDDGQFFYVSLGALILLKILPYREEHWRYFVFNSLTDEVVKIDDIGQSCVQLPEDHGIIFPGGYYLQTGEMKKFEGDALASLEDGQSLKFKRMIKSPNGEDVLFVFYEPEQGLFGLFSYNLISKSMQNPIYGHGYALAEDGMLVIFSAESEPTRIHPMQIWQTAYVSADYASRAEVSQSFFGKIGNASLVRGVSDLYSLHRMISDQTVSARIYEELSKTANRFFDSHYWIEEYSNNQEAQVDKNNSIAALIKQILTTSELVIDEFEKVQSIRQQSQLAMTSAEEEQQKLIASIRPENWQVAEEFVAALNSLRQQRGHLVTIKENRYIDTDRLKELDQQLIQAQEKLSESTVEFLSEEAALSPYFDRIKTFDKEVNDAETIAVLAPIIEQIEETASGLDLLSELMSSLKVNDATIRTRIIDAISEVYSKLNQCRAAAKHKQKSVGSEEAIAQFSAQFKLFSQSITNALGMSTTPERCDEQLSRLLVQLEELESQFSGFEEFLSDIMAKRDEVYQSFESHKQLLLDERLRKAQSVTDAANRILRSIERRSLKFTDAEQLNTYFASDSLVLKTRDMVERLRELENSVKADDVESRFKSIKEQALRSLRDKTDIYEDGGNVIKLGPRHKFSVNTQELDLTIVPRNGELNIHLTGTDYFEELTRTDLLELRPYWEMAIESESPDVYRSEYLVCLILQAADNNTDGLNNEILSHALLDEDKLISLVRDFANPRYKEGYEKGIHDHDAVLLLQKLLPAMDSADQLRFDPLCRGVAQIFWANIQHLETDATDNLLALKDQIQSWHERAQSAFKMKEIFNNNKAIQLLRAEMLEALTDFNNHYGLPSTQHELSRSADYLVHELGRDRIEFIASKYAQQLVNELKNSLDSSSWRKLHGTLDTLKGKVASRWNLTQSWLTALVEGKGLMHLARYIPEAVAMINAEGRIERRPTEVDTELSITGLLGDHPRIDKQKMTLAIDEFLQRLDDHQQRVVTGFHHYHKMRQGIIEQERDLLSLESFKPKPLSSFVRNRLINESYLPLIGDNLAKQMGTLGENKRSDLMGLLMMISPPGYGKTTLMEYIASRLGLIFMKINCPSLGHDVLSLDPEQAPNATARQELEKLNLGLEMGTNVMLYLDDIQHTHPEFLQKFISLCDGTRRIEGIWKGKSKTYDMRGKKFCVVMAGNPYTETGEAFQVPDMLANRADIYNLGDILGGMDEQFALSYVENCMTSNTVLAPLATRDLNDLYKIVRMTQGENIATTDLSHQYSGAEINEITAVLKKLFVIQDVVLKINQQYIASAAQSDEYRIEPSFRLQGSYRNMNKMAEKVSSVMNHGELMQMIADHYVGESQLLTNGSEENLLKLAELRGEMTAEEVTRWAKIKADFIRNKAMGGDDADVGGKVIGQLVDLVNGVRSLGENAEQTRQMRERDKQSRIEAETRYRNEEILFRNEEALRRSKEQPYETASIKQLEGLNQSLSQFASVVSTGIKLIAQQSSKQIAPNVEVINQPVPGLDKILKALADTMENSIFPIVRSMDRKIDIDLKTHDKMKEISTQLRALETEYSAKEIDKN